MINTLFDTPLPTTTPPMPPLSLPEQYRPSNLEEGQTLTIERVDGVIGIFTRVEGELILDLTIPGLVVDMEQSRVDSDIAFDLLLEECKKAGGCEFTLS